MHGLRQGIEGQPLGESLPVVCFDSLPRSGELTMVHECPALIVEAPEFARNKFAIPRRESRQSCGLVLVKGFAFGISLRIAGGADVMQLKVGIRGHHNYTTMCSQAGKRQRIARQVHCECRGANWIVCRAEL